MGIVNGTFTPPLTLGEMSSFFGIGGNDGAEMFKAKYYNLNSFYKPLNAPITIGAGDKGSLSDAQRRQYNWGWSALGGDTFAGTLQESLAAKWDNKTWQADAPTGGINSSPYRAADFYNYNHNARFPFLVELDSTTISRGNALRFAINDMSEIEQLPNWGYFSGTTLNKIGLGVYIGQSKPTTSGFRVYMLAAAKALHTLSDIISDNEKLLNVPATYLNYIGATSGTWYMIPFLIVDSSDMTIGTYGDVYITDGEYKTMLFPQNKLSFNIKFTVVVRPIDYIEVEVYNTNVVFDQMTNVIDVKSLVLQLTNTGNNAYTVSISSVPSENYTVKGSYGGDLQDATVSVPANGSKTVEIGPSAWETIGQVAMIDVTIAVGSDTKTNTLVVYNSKDE